MTNAAYLGHFAEVDPYEPLECVPVMENAIRNAGKEVTTHLYPGVGRWFFEEDREGFYNPEAAQLAFDRTLAFLKQSTS